MAHWRKYDDNGNYIHGEDVHSDVKPPGNYTDVEFPNPCWAGVFKGGKWIETDTESYNNWLANKDKPVESPKSEIDILKEQNTELNTQIIEIWEMLLMGGVI